ncbi:MAG: zinc ribbon domain-containing protein, partial [Burkholderiales bacterium]
LASALAAPRHRALLLLDLYGMILVIAAVVMSLTFVRAFDVAAPWRDNRFALVGTSAILAVMAAFCFQAAARLWGRFNFESILTWVEMVGSYQTSRIGTGNNFSSRMNTENDVVRTEAMTLRVWRARIESVVFGKDDARQVTAMFSTEQEALALSADLTTFARSQSVLVAPFSNEDQARINALNAGERAIAPANDAGAAAQVQHHLHAAAAIASVGGVSSGQYTVPMNSKRFCSACGTEIAGGARFCSNCAAPVARG